MLVSDGLAVVFYLAVILTSREVHTRAIRIFFRLVMTLLAFIGPTRALVECKFWLQRDYDPRLYDLNPSGARGFRYEEQLQCPGNDVNAIRGNDNSVLSTYHLLRRRCIVALTVSVLIVLELVCYCRSNEGSGPSPHEELAAPIDIEMEGASDRPKMPAALNPVPVLTTPPLRLR
ncbi:hypothetical protein BGZ72_009158 [Mortierella alpina]|nr:hypothetical protein BGZ72_009158 [Mortierella alpina]